MKRVVIVSDLHCGSRVGLTPTGYQFALSDASPQRSKFGQLQRELWTFYSNTIASLQPIDWLVCNGDAIDGRGSRNGGVELVTSDLSEQAEMAHAALASTNASHFLLTYGTPCHVGPDGEDWERSISDRLRGHIGGHEWLDVNGCIFDFKHKVGSSSVPYGRHTAISRERLWNVLWNEREWAPKSNIIVRSHVHYHEFSGNPTHLAMTTPALQGPGSQYGVRQCSGIVDFGLISFDIQPNGRYAWTAHLLDIGTTRPKPLKA